MPRWARAPTTILCELLASRAVTRVGGGVRTAERARSAHRARRAQGDRRNGGLRILRCWNEIVKDAWDPTGWLSRSIPRAATWWCKAGTKLRSVTAEDVLQHFEPYCSGFLCTYVDKEGMMEGTDLDWFRRLRDRTSHEITAAGGITTIEDIRTLHQLNINAALGMAIYTGRLDLAELAGLTFA